MLSKRSLLASALPTPGFALIRAASSYARKSVLDTRPLKQSNRKTQDTKQRQLDAQHKNQAHQSARSASPLNSLPASTHESHKLANSESYFVQRTPTRNLPIYQLRKRGGNLKQTRLRKISGQTVDLLRVLEESLSPTPEWSRINPVTGHIEMKGWYKDQIEKFLVAKGF